METPHFINGNFKWYKDEKYQKYLELEQAENLPSLTDFAVFNVVNEKESINDYVLINHKQEVVKDYSYNKQGAEQLEAFINILKVSKHFDKEEKSLRKNRSYGRF